MGLLRAFVFILFIIAFFCGVASLFGNDWASVRRNGTREVTRGLWEECRQSNNTIDSVRADLCRGYSLNGDDVETRVLLTRWIAVGGLAAGVMTFLLLILALREDALDEEEKGSTCRSSCLIVFWLILQGLAMVAALAAYTHYFMSDLKDAGFTLGWSFALGWASAGVFMLSAVFLTVGSCISGDCSCGDEEE